MRFTTPPLTKEAPFAVLFLLMMRRAGCELWMKRIIDMNIWQKYKSPLGYYNNDNQIDSYGVNHSGFSIRDELNYQNARLEREKQLTDLLQNQKISSLPQYTTNFWNKSADNNYGFGISNISDSTNNQQLQILQQNYNAYQNKILWNKLLVLLGICRVIILI